MDQTDQMSGPDGTKIGTDLSITSAMLMNPISGKVGIAPPQVSQRGVAQSHVEQSQCDEDAHSDEHVCFPGAGRVSTKIPSEGPSAAGTAGGRSEGTNSTRFGEKIGAPDQRLIVDCRVMFSFVKNGST